MPPRPNTQVDTDAQGRPLGRCAPCAPFHGRRSHARYMAWALCNRVVGGFVQEPGVGAKARCHPARRGAFCAVGARVRWLALVSSPATAGQLRYGCVVVSSVAGPGAWQGLGHAAFLGHAFHGQRRSRHARVVASNATASYNPQVDTDALRRPLAAPAPGASRRSHAR